MIYQGSNGYKFLIHQGLPSINRLKLDELHEGCILVLLIPSHKSGHAIQVAM